MATAGIITGAGERGSASTGLERGSSDPRSPRGRRRGTSYTSETVRLSEGVVLGSVRMKLCRAGPVGDFQSQASAPESSA